MAAFNHPAELNGRRLLAVADRQDRQARIKHRLRGAGRTFARHRIRTAGEDDRLGLELQKGLVGLLVGVNFAINAGLAHTPRDQLRHLRAEIDDEDAVVKHER